jgi:hypothetical protein
VVEQAASRRLEHFYSKLFRVRLGHLDDTEVELACKEKTIKKRAFFRVSAGKVEQTPAKDAFGGATGRLAGRKTTMRTVYG